VILHGKDPSVHHRWPSRSEALFWVCCELVRGGVDEGVILGIITDARFGISESVRDKGHKAEAYARRQLARAHQLVTDDFHTDDKHRPYPRSQHNIRLALVKLGVEVSYDEFADRLLVAGMEAIGPYLDDPAVVRLYLEAEAQFGVKAPKEFFYDVQTELSLKPVHGPDRCSRAQCRLWTSRQQTSLSEPARVGETHSISPERLRPQHACIDPVAAAYRHRVTVVAFVPMPCGAPKQAPRAAFQSQV
jgi:hypothetical protein